MLLISQPKRILISRTDSIGDVVLTLPLAGILKQKFPQTEIYFIGKNYTKAVINCSKNVNQFLSWDELDAKSEKDAVSFLKSFNFSAIVHVFPNKKLAFLAKSAQIENRIGVNRRIFHWFTCNYKPSFSRKSSDLHEAQLNVKLLAPFGIEDNFSQKDLAKFYNFSPTVELTSGLENLIEKDKLNIIIHPKSKGSAKEWGLDNFIKLVEILPKSKFKIFVSGTNDDALQIKNQSKLLNMEVTDLTGKMNLEQFIAFIQKTDALIAASTGPLHIASALGKHAVGLYSSIKPIHPGRWSPIGENAFYFEANEPTNERIGDRSILDIQPEKVADYLAHINKIH